MFDKFQQMGQQVSQLKKIRDQAVQMQKQLQAEVIEVEENGIRVVMTGDAIKKSQQVAAKKLQEMSGGLKGLLGGGMA